MMRDDGHEGGRRGGAAIRSRKRFPSITFTRSNATRIFKIMKPSRSACWPRPARRWRRSLRLTASQYYYQNPQSPGQPTKEPVKVLIKFKNAEANSLGVPLPAGTVRVYQGDSKGRVQFIGEDRIDHTPKDETVSLHIGNAFDVVAERKQTDFQRLGSRSVEVEYEISLRNHKPDPITVFVNEPIGGDWTMLNSTFKFEKTAAFAARFTVPVAANSEALLKYRVRIHW